MSVIGADEQSVVVVRARVVAAIISKLAFYVIKSLFQMLPLELFQEIVLINLLSLEEESFIFLFLLKL